jgi:hypothetical protein
MPAAIGIFHGDPATHSLSPTPTHSSDGRQGETHMKSINVIGAAIAGLIAIAGAAYAATDVNPAGAPAVPLYSPYEMFLEGKGPVVEAGAATGAGEPISPTIPAGGASPVADDLPEGAYEVPDYYWAN